MMGRIHAVGCTSNRLALVLCLVSHLPHLASLHINACNFSTFLPMDIGIRELLISTWRSLVTTGSDAVLTQI